MQFSFYINILHDVCVFLLSLFRLEPALMKQFKFIPDKSLAYSSYDYTLIICLITVIIWVIS